MADSDIIEPSTFRRIIKIKQPITLQDAAGGIGTSGYTLLRQKFAYVENLSTDRKAYYGMDLFTSVYKIIFRYAVSQETEIPLNYIIEYSGYNLIIKSTQLIRQDYKTFWQLLCVQSDLS